MSKLFEDLKKGLEEIVAYEKGKEKLRTRKIKVPEPPSQYTAKDIKKYVKKPIILKVFLQMS